MITPNHQIREEKLHFSRSSAEVATANMAPIAIKSVLISESVDPRCKSILEENGIRVTEKQNMKKDELIAEIKVSCAAFAKGSILGRYTRLMSLKLRVSNCISDQVTSFKTTAAASAFVHGFDPCTAHLISRSLLRFSAVYRVKIGASAAPC